MAPQKPNKFSDRTVGVCTHIVVYQIVQKNRVLWSRAHAVSPIGVTKYRQPVNRFQERQLSVWTSLICDSFDVLCVLIVLCSIVIGRHIQVSLVEIDKGKLIERWGRKASGLRGNLGQRGCQYRRCIQLLRPASSVNRNQVPCQIDAAH